MMIMKHDSGASTGDVDSAYDANKYEGFDDDKDHDHDDIGSGFTACPFIGLPIPISCGLCVCSAITREYVQHQDGKRAHPLREITKKIAVSSSLASFCRRHHLDRTLFQRPDVFWGCSICARWAPSGACRLVF